MRLLCHLRLVGFLAAALVGVATPTQALPITYSFGGTFNTVSTSAVPEVQIGTTFTGSFSYDPADNVADRTTAAAAYYNALTAFSLMVGSNPLDTITSNLGLAAVGNSGVDQFGIAPATTYSGPTVNLSPFSGLIGGFAAVPGQVSLILDGPDTLFSDTSLPSGIAIGDFTGNLRFFLSLDLGGDQQLTANGILDPRQFEFQSPSAIATPEPATLLLFGSGLAAACVRRYRQRKP